jgi:hypothetical protein
LLRYSPLYEINEIIESLKPSISANPEYKNSVKHKR